MIGNDVVDLVLARQESNWQRKGFLNKLFTEKERLLIINTADPETKVWDLWSRKEAVYKIYNRKTGVRAFMPLRIKHVDDFTSGQFVFGKMQILDAVFFTKTKITESHIVTYSASEEGELDKIKEIVDVELRRSIVRDIHGLPYLPKNLDERSNISVSHHGKFCSYITT